MVYSFCKNNKLSVCNVHFKFEEEHKYEDLVPATKNKNKIKYGGKLDI